MKHEMFHLSNFYQSKHFLILEQYFRISKINNIFFSQDHKADVARAQEMKALKYSKLVKIFPKIDSKNSSKSDPASSSKSDP